ncbi:MAG TPA: permease prefix domain 2-containing transporter [Candidatus Baltobacteraceae bacterium]|nr:permease prefix domain 2-containing transporter [Candidatus Baltobacteraceae bacterium]
MRPPIIAEALVAATAPAADFESIAGDLHEQYLCYVRQSGTKDANRWYWAQVLVSMPWLLSYSRSDRSPLRNVAVMLTTLAVLVAMLLATIPIDAALHVLFGRYPLWALFAADWGDAAAFGAVLALIVGNGGVKVAFYAASFLVLAYLVPALLGFPSSQAPLAAWILLFGAIPAMCAGAVFCRMMIAPGFRRTN